MKSVIKQNFLYVKCDEAENTPSLFIFIFLYSCLIKIKINYQCEKCVSQWVSDIFVMSNEQFFSHIITRTSWYGDDIWYPLLTRSTLWVGFL
jgi:hypothetical protein